MWDSWIPDIIHAVETAGRNELIYEYMEPNHEQRVRCNVSDYKKARRTLVSIWNIIRRSE